MVGRAASDPHARAVRRAARAAFGTYHDRPQGCSPARARSSGMGGGARRVRARARGRRRGISVQRDHPEPIDQRPARGPRADPTRALDRMEWTGRARAAHVRRHRRVLHGGPLPQRQPPRAHRRGAACRAGRRAHRAARAPIAGPLLRARDDRVRPRHGAHLLRAAGRAGQPVRGRAAADDLRHLLQVAARVPRAVRHLRRDDGGRLGRLPAFEARQAPRRHARQLGGVHDDRPRRAKAEARSLLPVGRARSRRRVPARDAARHSVRRPTSGCSPASRSCCSS